MVDVEIYVVDFVFFDFEVDCVCDDVVWCEFGVWIV